MPNYLVIATSGRAIAQGLKSLGYSVAVIDGFADRDTCVAATEIIKVQRTQYSLEVDDVLRAVTSLQSKKPFDGLFFDAAVESNPSLLNELNLHPVFGNSIQVLNACNHPEKFFSSLDQHSIPYPEIHLDLKLVSTEKSDWLVKAAQGTGGIGVSCLKEKLDTTKHVYLQKRIDGINFSLTFLANGQDVLALGFNTLWSQSLGEGVPYAYAGAVNQVSFNEEAKHTALQYTKTIANKFELIGLNSIDFIYVDNLIYVLEINPRIPATYELYETKGGEVMQQHIDACKNRVLPVTQSNPLLRAHAIVYAPSKLTISDKMSWPLWTADRPHAQEVINEFEPVCSVFAGGQNNTQVCEMIKTRKQSILAKLCE